MARVFEMVDFGGEATRLVKMELVAEKTAVGPVIGQIRLDGGGLVQERQVYREVRPDFCARTYTIEPGNPWDLKVWICRGS